MMMAAETNPDRRAPTETTEYLGGLTLTDSAARTMPVVKAQAGTEPILSANLLSLFMVMNKGW